jgi:hypothetical protein
MLERLKKGREGVEVLFLLFILFVYFKNAKKFSSFDVRQRSLKAKRMLKATHDAIDNLVTGDDVFFSILFMFFFYS